MRISLADYPGVDVLIKSFQVTITCVVTSLTLSTPTGPTIMQVGIDGQPFSILFGTTKFPNILQNPSFILITPPSSMMKVINPDGISGKVSLTGTTIAETGTYSISGVVDSQIVGFSVIIKDPCESAILEIAPASLTDMKNYSLLQDQRTKAANL